MALMRRPSPLADVVTLRDAMERMLDERFGRPVWPFSAEHHEVPALDLYTTIDSVVAKVALPGMNAEDVKVSIADDVVTVSGTFGEEKETSAEGFLRQELSRGSVQRSFAIPATVNADAAKATFKDGLLTLTLPKTEAVKPKQVDVEVEPG